VETAEWPLWGRDEELALFTEVVIAGRGSLVVAGAMGVGKSRLVADMLRRHATEEGDTVQVVPVRATRSTATIPFGPFAAWASATSAPTGDRLGALQAISRTLLDGTDRLVVAVDDAHLLDDGSAALVLHLVEHTPASVVATLRTGERCPDAVTAIWKEGLAPWVGLQALSQPETAELVETVLGGPLDVAARRRLWEWTQGVPLYIREVVRAGLSAGVLTCIDGVWHWRGELPFGGRLADLIGERLAQVAEDQREALELLAYGEPLPVDVMDQLGQKGALMAAERQGLVLVDPGTPGITSPVARLVHPLYAEMLRATVPTLTARDHQRRLGNAAAATGWHEREPLRVASWWLAGGETPAEAATFLDAARQALALAEWPLAERLADAATEAGAGPRATLTRSMALEMTGRRGDADEVLAELSFDDLDDALLVEVATARAGMVLLNRGEIELALDILADAAARLSGPARAEVVAQSGYLAITAGRIDDAVRAAMEALGDAEDDTLVRVRALAVAILGWSMRGDTGLALRMAELTLPYVPGVVATNPSPVALNGIGILSVAYAIALILAGRIDEATAVSEATMAAAGASDFRILYAVSAALDGRMALWRGRPAVTRQRGEEGLTIVRDLGAPFEWPAAVTAMGAAQLGDVITARAALAWIDRAPHRPIGLYEIELGQGRGWLHAAQGELAAARTQLLAVADQATGYGAHLFALLPLLDVARLGGARDVAPRLVALTDRVEGVFAELAARFATSLAGDDAAGLDTVSERYRDLGFELLAAEAAAAAAGLHRAAGRRGSYLTSVGRARELAARCEGACTPLVRDLDVQPAVATLTDREREVVELAARGLSNRQIAERLFLSVRTVHTHLHHAYTKLDTSDRDRLPFIIAPPDRSNEPSPPPAP
jgi:DNA-binding CsgD family transcriptional regulator